MFTFQVFSHHCTIDRHILNLICVLKERFRMQSLLRRVFSSSWYYHWLTSIAASALSAAHCYILFCIYCFTFSFVTKSALTSVGFVSEKTSTAIGYPLSWTLLHLNSHPPCILRLKVSNRISLRNSWGSFWGLRQVSVFVQCSHGLQQELCGDNEHRVWLWCLLRSGSGPCLLATADD